MTPPQPVGEPAEPTTDYQRQVDALARSMAASNPNAAIDLAQRLLWYVQQARRLAKGSIGLNLNFVTGRLEIRTGEEK
jgi:hypothetical protein